MKQRIRDAAEAEEQEFYDGGAVMNGLPPTPCGFDRSLRTAEARWAMVIRPAFDLALEEALY